MYKKDFIKAVNNIGIGARVETRDEENTIFYDYCFMNGDVKGTYKSELLGSVFCNNIKELASMTYQFLSYEFQEDIIMVYK